jgi:hypothetical protein
MLLGFCENILDLTQAFQNSQILSFLKAFLKSKFDEIFQEIFAANFLLKIITRNLIHLTI